MLNLKIFKDDRGDLTPIEFGEDLPFIPQRAFIVKNVPAGCRRGEHAHYKTEQFLICLKGLIKVVVTNGTQDRTVILSEGETIFIGNLTWDYQEFSSEQDVLLVFCSTHFDINDYITDYSTFLKTVKHD